MPAANSLPSKPSTRCWTCSEAAAPSQRLRADRRGRRPRRGQGVGGALAEGRAAVAARRRADHDQGHHAGQGLADALRLARHRRDRRQRRTRPSSTGCRPRGLVLLGKTTTPEFGWKALTDSPLQGTTRSPWDLRHSPGGSSGGAAALTAAGINPLQPRQRRRRLDPHPGRASPASSA